MKYYFKGRNFWLVNGDCLEVMKEIPSDSVDMVIIVTDSVKFHQKGVVNLLRTEDVDCIYTDSDVPSEVEEYLLGKNIEVWYG